MPQFKIAPVLKGSITAYDVLHSQGTFVFKTSKTAHLKDGLLFLLNEKDFLFSYRIENQSLVVQRNNVKNKLSFANAPKNTELTIFMMWSFSQLSLICSYGIGESQQLKSKVPTEPCAPPVSLVKWARQQNLIPIETYQSEENFRNKVHSCLQSIQDKIDESGGFSQFWNVNYDGNRIVSRKPKRETEIHPTIHCLLSDQALISSFEVIPEFHSGIGDLDFLIIGKLDDGQSSKLCIEFKNAHSDDLFHGITKQLPEYMGNCKSTYGVYCVLNYNGEWFKNKSFKNDTDLWIQLSSRTMSVLDPIQDQIRTIILNLSKPKSASKR